jgi:glycosyltransferase involved in cell wall biosynthesis
MRFLLAGNCFGRGGIQTHLRWTAKLLRDEGHQVALLPTLPRQSGEDELNSLRQIGVEIGDFGERNGSKLTKFRRLPSMIQFIRRFRPDVYFVVGAGWVPMVLKPLAASSTRAIFFEVMSGRWYNRRPDPRALATWCFDEVVGQSPRVGVAFRRGFSWRRPVPIIPAIPEPLEQVTKIPPAETRPIPRGTAKAAMFSRLAPSKRAFWLVRQWGALRDVLSELHIHGDGSDAKPIQDWIREQGLAQRVFFHGQYPDGQEHVDLVRSYDLTLLPTIGDEGAPLVLLESMACGVPFVAGAAGGIPDYGRGNPDCIIASIGSDNFIQAVRTLANRLDRGQVDQRRIQQFYQDRFRHELLADCWARFLTGESKSPFDWPRDSVGLTRMIV